MHHVLAPAMQSCSGAPHLGSSSNLGWAVRMNHGDIEQDGTMGQWTGGVTFMLMRACFRSCSRTYRVTNTVYALYMHTKTVNASMFETAYLCRLKYR
jgi:hypothetical protein